jgi:hypothetical protein
MERGLRIPRLYNKAVSKYPVPLVPRLFAALSERRDEIRFMSWFALHDPQRTSCDSNAITFIEPGTKPDLYSDAMPAFVTFICYFGLRHSDGIPKQV